jgi:hypothetical protein
MKAQCHQLIEASAIQAVTGCPIPLHTFPDCALDGLFGSKGIFPELAQRQKQGSLMVPSMAGYFMPLLCSILQTRFQLSCQFTEYKQGSFGVKLSHCEKKGIQPIEHGIRRTSFHIVEIVEVPPILHVQGDGGSSNRRL